MSAAARRVAALGERRIFTAASLRDPAGLRALVLVTALGARPVAVSARGVRVLRVPAASDLAAADRVDGLFAVRVVRAVLPFTAALRVVPVVVRFVARVVAVAFGARVVAADRVPRPVVAAFVVRTGVLRAGVLRAAVPALARPAGARLAAARVVDVRVVAARPVAARFAAGAALARVVFFGALFADVALAVRVAGARVALAAVLPRVVDGLAARVALDGAFGLAAGFFAAGERSDAVTPARVVRATVPRALVPAVRRPPVRTAMARLRRPSVVVSLLMLGVLCSVSKLVGMSKDA